VASVTSNGVDGQLPPAQVESKLEMRENPRPTESGKHHLARLALSRAEVKASEQSVIASMEKVNEKERTLLSNILGKL